MQFTSMIPSMNRLLFACVTWVGVACVLLSTRYPWFSLPATRGGPANSIEDIVAIEPTATRFFQAAMIIGIALMAMSLLRKRKGSRVNNIVACGMFVATLCYPYAVMIHSPSLSADATWLQMQHDNLMWLGGDINVSAENGSAFWGNKIYSVDIPRQIKVVAIPSKNGWQLGLHNLADLFSWLGYSEAFCQFSRSGWTFAVCGWAVMVVGTLVVNGEVQMDRVGIYCAFCTIACIGSCIFAWMGPVNAADAIDKALRLTSQCEYARAIEMLEVACKRLPVLCQDTHYIAQRGLLESKLGKRSPYSVLFNATDAERRCQYDVAYEAFLNLIDSPDPAIAREALRAVQRFAIQDFNSGRVELAAMRLRIVLTHQPCNLKVIYLLQVCYLRQNRTNEVHAMSDWMAVAASHLSFSSKKILRSTSHKFSAIAAMQEGNAMETWIHSSRAKNP